MKISTEIYYPAKKLGFEEAIKLCAKAGFDAWDFSLFDMKCTGDGIILPLHDGTILKGDQCIAYAEHLKQVSLENGIVCNQSHGPFPVYKSEVKDALKCAIECTAAAGGEICIIHPDNDKTAEENAIMYRELLPIAKGCGVKIATENMWNWDYQKEQSSFAACATGDDFKKHVDVVNDASLVACLDLGHAEMRGSGDGAVNMIHTLGNRIQALHIHDNDCWHDNHQIPFSMNIDFEPITKALREIDYKGYFTLEADAFLLDYKEEDFLEGMIQLKESVKKLADLFEQL